MKRFSTSILALALELNAYADASAHDGDLQQLDCHLRDRTARSEVLQTLAKKLNAPATYFDPPASGSVHQVASQPDDPE
jgi:hypothetical protein